MTQPKRIRQVALLTALLFASSASAQTSGTLTTQTAVNWSTAPWTITAGAGTFPDGGGVATWGTHTNTLIGTVAVSATVTLDVPINLSSIIYNSPFSMTLAGTNALTLPATGGTFDAQLSIANTLTLFQLANQISAPIAGGGTAGVTKTGAFIMSLAGNNTYTGGTHINGGLMFATGANADATFGATGAGNGISMNGGQLGINITGGWTTSRDIFVDQGGGAILPVTAATINGVISGSGDLSFPAFTSAVTLGGTNTFTGAIRKVTTGGTITLSGNGVLNQASLYDYAGTLTLSNTATNINDRISDTAPITAHQMTTNLLGNAGAATSEVAGALTLAHGINSIVVTPDPAQAASLTYASITRQNNSTLQLRGTNLGAAPGAGVAQIISTASPGTLVGGGGAAGTTNISILPWAVGNTVAASPNSSSFVTWNSTGGAFRPLAVSEYAPLTSGVTVTDNTSVGVATTISAPTTVNSVLVTGTGTLLTGTGGLNITSGALMYSPAAAATAGTVSANINFGTAEGVVTSTAGTVNSFTPGLTLSGVLSGSGGLTLNPIIGSSIALTGANTYTGTTTILGFTVLSGTISNDGVTPSPLGLSTSPVVINSANGITGLGFTAATTMNRNISVIGGPKATGAQLLSTGSAVTVNGNIDLQAQLTVQSTAGIFALNGVVSGPAFLTDLGTNPTIQLNGANTYSGGTNIQTGTYAVGIDSTGSTGAFGTGTIFMTGLGKIQSVDATAHTVSNNMFLGANPTFQGTGNLTFTGNLNLNGSRTATVTNPQTAISGTVSNGSLTKAGTGTLLLSNPSGNTYTGGTNITTGTLQIANTSGSATGTGTVNVAAGATLAGRGIISGATSVAGTLRAGASPGVLTVSSALTMITGSTFLGDVQGTTPGNGTNNHSQLIVGGPLTLNNPALSLNFAGYTPAPTDQIALVRYGTLTGTFNGLPEGAVAFPNVLGSGVDYRIFYGTVSGFASTITLSPVPEPLHILAVAGLGAAGFRWVRKRRKAQAV